MRSLSKQVIGNMAGSIAVEGWVEGSVATEELFIIKQLSTSIVLCGAVAAPSRTGAVTLQGTAPTAIGQGRISATPFGGAPVEYVQKFARHLLYTFSDNAYEYIVNVNASAPGQATVAVI
jgi:hypothetical protein